MVVLGTDTGELINFLKQTIFDDLISWNTKNPASLDILYKSRHAVQCIFRALPPIARLYVCRLVFLPPTDAILDVSIFRSALRPRQRARDRHDAAIRALRMLRIIVEHDDGPLMLHRDFGSCLRNAIAGEWDKVFGGEVGEGEMGELEEYSRGKWEGILNFLVGADQEAGLKPCASVIVGLTRTGLLEDSEGGLTLSSLGFQFLLKDSYAQVWVLIRDIVKHSPETSVEILDFLFQLNFAVPGKAYALCALNESHQELLPELADLGVVMIKDTLFYPTQLGVNLVAAASRCGGESGEDGNVAAKTAGEVRIIVETNFRVYAYTTSSFQVNLLGLFCHLAYQLPNLVVGYLTRDAVRQALLSGISAAQIIGYLNSHAYVEKGCTSIPSNVADEIRLWEAEEGRLHTEEAVFLNEFDDAVQFQKVLQHAKEIGGCLWEDSLRQKLVVTEKLYPNIKRFIKNSAR